MLISASSQSGAQGVLRVGLLLGADSSLPAALGSLQTQDPPGGPSAQGGPQTAPSHLHPELPAPGVQRLCPLKSVVQPFGVRLLQHESILYYYYYFATKAFRRKKLLFPLTFLPDQSLSTATWFILYHKREL